MTDKQKEGSTFHDFLIGDRYRIWRHLLLIGGMICIAAEQTNNYHILDRTSTQSILSLIVVAIIHLSIIYINLYILAPKLLYTKKYLKYIIWTTSSIIVLYLTLGIAEYLIYGQISLTRTSVYSLNFLNIAALIDFVFVFALALVCLSGILSTSVLRQLEIENANISQLKKDYLLSEVEQLKDRISPDFLFAILNNAGKTATEDPEASSISLVRLSKILRYQLYDCSRDKVLLKSEIAFIENFLSLYQFHNKTFRYDITTDGDTEKIFVPPLLFIPLIQVMADTSHESILYIKFIITDNTIGFICNSDSKDNERFNNADFSGIQQRLEFLYQDSYILTINSKMIVLQLNAL
ncbi:sensor histidine kinase [Dysgonomonas sp. 25]|uniref:sensor histidine kinase n=1 Tax=Dysgonomonas sp. 25 TaxID=2302933 RepID=UPI0013D77CFE|nr:sensor histidine kinase [Dysgonomonas sp. 25]